MALDASKAMIARTGSFLVADSILSTPVLSGSAALPAGYVDLGYLTSAGVTHSQSIDTNNISGWQNSDVLATTKTNATSTLQLAFAQVTEEVLAFVNNAVVDPATGGITLDPGAPAIRRSMVLNVTDGTRSLRLWVPAGEVTSKEDTTYSAEDIIANGVTITAYKANIGGTEYGPVVMYVPDFVDETP